MSSSFASTIRVAIIALMLCSSVVVRAQSISWQDISGVPGSNILLRNTNGKIFALRAGEPSAYDGAMVNSTDDGITWTDGPLPKGGWIHDFAANGDVYVVNREFPSSTVRFNHQVHLSTNGGSSFSAIVSQEFFEPLHHFMVMTNGAVYGVQYQTFFTGPKRLVRYAGSLNAWTLVGTPFLVADNVSENLARFTTTDASDKIYVGSTHDGIFITSDFGVTWKHGLTDRSVSYIKVVNDSTILAATTPWAEQNYVVPTNGGVFMSTDSGTTWRPYGLANKQITAVDIDAQGNLYATANDGIWRRPAGAPAWSPIGPSNDEFTGLLLIDANTIVVSHPELGIFRSTDAGASWVQNGVRSRDVFSLAVDDANTIFVGTIGGRVFRSSDGGRIWRQSPKGSICDYIYGFANTPTALYAGTDCGVYRTTDRGDSWSNISDSVITSPAYGVVVSSTGTLIAGTEYGVYRSTDEGATWLSGGLTNFKVLYLASSSAGGVYAATENDGVFLSTDDGASWVGRGLVRNDLQTIDVNDSGTLFAGVYGGLFRSTDRGGSWDFRNFIGGYVYALAFKGQSVYAGSYNGVYSSPDDGVSWQSMPQAGLDHPFILSLDFDQSGNLLAGSYRGAIYRTSQPLSGPALLSADDRAGIPSEFRMRQNYPNPFNPVTDIRFEVPVTGFVSLIVYNILGQEVATLVDGLKSPGRYAVRWDAGSAASGVYLCRLQASGFTSVQKMLLAK